jgi:hypothetical protein
MAKKLRRVAVSRAGGVWLGATHADWTLANIRFGRALDRRIRGCRLKLLVNMAENGQGPTPRTVPPHLCDKGHRYGLGPMPESPTRHPGVIYGPVHAAVLRPAGQVGRLPGAKPDQECLRQGGIGPPCGRLRQFGRFESPHSRGSKTVRSMRARRAGSRRTSMVVIRPLCSVRAAIA